jgi:tetratricopeptide (TPR) repeat protein
VNRQLGLLYLRQKEYAKSAELFEKVIADEETTHGILNNLGVARLALGQQDQAEQTFRQAIQINPRYPLSYFNLATLYLRNEQTEKAAEYFEKYLEFKPGDLNTAQTYAMVLLKLERWAPASLLLDQISRQTPDVAPIHFRLAEALSHLQKPAEAMIALRRATQLVDPRQALAWMSRPEFDLLRGETAFRDLLTELGTAD